MPLYSKIMNANKIKNVSAPIKPVVKPAYENLESVKKELFPEKQQVEEKVDDISKQCNTKGCPIKFITENDEIRCEECRKFNIGLVIACASKCGDYAKMTHKQIKIMNENNYKPFTKCFNCSKNNENTKFTMVWAYDEKCVTEECDGRIQLNQSKVDFFKQPHMKMPMHCYDCIQVRKADKNTNVECECATCGDKVVMSRMQKISVEKNHLISCESCRTTMTKNCAYKSCNKPFLSKARETELKTTFKKNYRDEPCCSKECFLLFSKK